MKTFGITMTVRELIEALQNKSPDKPVIYAISEDDGRWSSDHEINSVSETDDGVYLLI